MLTEYTTNPNGFSNIQVGSCSNQMPLPPKGPSQALYCGPIQTDKQVNMPRSCSTDVLSEDPPPWFEDLLNEPESPVNKSHHRRSASDSFTYLAADSSMDWLWHKNSAGGPACNYQMLPNFNGGMRPQVSNKSRKPGSGSKTPVNSASLPNVLINAKEDADCQALGMTCSPEPDRVRPAGSETENKGAAASNASETSSRGADSSNTKQPLASNNADAKRKQHNARRSRVRKLQYIAELERNAQALQITQGLICSRVVQDLKPDIHSSVDAGSGSSSAQLEFLDQQNLILGLENRALKQRLESLSQEHYIKSMEQEILDKELGRLQYLYHLQRNVNHNQQQQQQQQQRRQKQNPAVHRRNRSFNDLVSQFSRNSLQCPSKAVAASNAANQ